MLIRLSLFNLKLLLFGPLLCLPILVPTYILPPGIAATAAFYASSAQAAANTATSGTTATNKTIDDGLLFEMTIS